MLFRLRREASTAIYRRFCFNIVYVVFTRCVRKMSALAQGYNSRLFRVKTTNDYRTNKQN